MPPRLADRLRQIAMDLPRIPAGDCREAAAALDRREAIVAAAEAWAKAKQAVKRHDRDTWLGITTQLRLERVVDAEDALLALLPEAD